MGHVAGWACDQIFVFRIGFPWQADTSSAGESYAPRYSVTPAWETACAAAWATTAWANATAWETTWAKTWASAWERTPSQSAAAYVVSKSSASVAKPTRSAGKVGDRGSTCRSAMEGSASEIDCSRKAPAPGEDGS